MDYIYHSWTYPMLFNGHCSCTCFTCLYKVDLVLLLIVIYLLLRDKVTINIDTSTYSLPLVPVNDNLNMMSNVVSSTSEPISLSSSKLTPSTSSSIINTSSPWDNMLISSGEALINSERSTPSDPPESLPESLSSFGSLGSIRRKLIKPDISLDFLDLSSSEEDESDNETGGKLRKSKDIDTDSLEECNVYSGCANDEHFYRDTSLSEETFTNDRITIVPLVTNSQPVDNKVTFVAC